MTDEEKKQADKLAELDAKYAQFEQPKKGLLIAMEQTMGNISESCRKAGVKSRGTFYNYCEGDTDFKQAVEDIEESNLDFAESMLKRSIKNGSDTALIFFLKTKAKKRGYIEKTETEHSGGVAINWIEQLTDDPQQETK